MKILRKHWELGSFRSCEQVLTSLHLELSICKAHLANMTSELGQWCGERGTPTRLSLALRLVIIHLSWSQYPLLSFPAHLCIPTSSHSRTRSYTTSRTGYLGSFINVLFMEMVKQSMPGNFQYINLKYGLCVCAQSILEVDVLEVSRHRLFHHFHK